MALPAEWRVGWLLRSVDEIAASYDGRSGGDGVPLMPVEWSSASYPELERQLARLREASPTARAVWWHTVARYRWGREARILVPLRAARGHRDPRPVLPPRTRLVSDGRREGRRALVLVYRWGERVDERVAELGLTVLARTMYAGDRGRIVLPPSVLAAVVGRNP